MKKYIIFSLAIMLALFSLTACGSSSTQDTISAELGIDVSGGEELSTSDTHGGFHGDGVSSVALSFSDSNVLDEIKENTEWKPFPLDETVQALVYGVKDETSSIGPFINDGNGQSACARNPKWLLHPDRPSRRSGDRYFRSSVFQCHGGTV